MKKYLIPAISVLLIAAVISLVLCHKEKESYEFGSLLPLSGVVSVYGQMIQRGQMMALEDIYEEYGDRVKITFFDTKHRMDVTLNRLIDANNKGIKHIVELLGSYQVEQCMNYAINHDMFILSGFDDKYELVEEGKGNFARILPSDAAVSQEIIQWMEKEGVNNVEILYVNDAWGKTQLHLAQSMIEESSLNLVGVFDMKWNQPSFTSTIAKMKAKKPDAVCLFIYPDDGGRFLKEARRQQFTPGFYVSDNFNGENMNMIAQNDVVGVRMVVPSTHEENESYKKMAQKYIAKYNEEPTFFALKGYDAVKVLYDILKRTGATNLDSIKGTIKSGYSFTGVTGSIQFDDKGEFVVTSFDHVEFIPTENGIKTKLIK